MRLPRDAMLAEKSLQGQVLLLEPPVYDALRMVVVDLGLIGLITALPSGILQWIISCRRTDNEMEKRKQEEGLATHHFAARNM